MRREGEERKGRTGGQLGKRNLGLVRATGSSSTNKRHEWSIRCLLLRTLHLELCGGSGLRAGSTEQDKEKICCGTLGKGRAISDAAHTTKPINPPGRGPSLSSLLTTTKTLFPWFNTSKGEELMDPATVEAITVPFSAL